MKNDEENKELEENESENQEKEKLPQIKEIQGDDLNNVDVELPTSLLV